MSILGQNLPHYLKKSRSVTYRIYVCLKKSGNNNEAILRNLLTGRNQWTDGRTKFKGLFWQS